METCSDAPLLLWWATEAELITMWHEVAWGSNDELQSTHPWLLWRSSKCFVDTVCDCLYNFVHVQPLLIGAGNSGIFCIGPEEPTPFVFLELKSTSSSGAPSDGVHHWSETCLLHNCNIAMGIPLYNIPDIRQLGKPISWLATDGYWHFVLESKISVW